MKLNHFTCPDCRLDWFDTAHYGTCERCGTFFYVGQSAPVGEEQPAAGVGKVYVNGTPLELWMRGFKGGFNDV